MRYLISFSGFILSLQLGRSTHDGVSVAVSGFAGSIALSVAVSASAGFCAYAALFVSFALLLLKF